MRRLISAVGLACALAASPGPALAIFFGWPDGNDHPNVGALLAASEFPDGTWAICSGTLISPTVFLTAAHCAVDLPEDVERVAVTFDSEYDSSTGTTYWGTWHPDLTYRPRQDDPHDLAVVVFDVPIEGITPAQLPAAGSLESLARGELLTAVGYGAQFITHNPGEGIVFHYNDTRYQAVSELVKVQQAFIRLSMNPALGNSGTCTGDSGGPNFLGTGGDEILAATTIAGDSNCRATNVVYRLDTDYARDFLDEFVSLP